MSWNGFAAILLLLCCGWAGHAATLYVSADGNDVNDGRSEKAAWRTIAYAAKQAKAGDTVLVAPGDYGPEQVVFANSGEEGKPIVVKGYGGRPKLKNNGGSKAVAFLIEGRAHVYIEGFDIEGYGHPGNRVSVIKSSDCRIRDIRGIGRGGTIHVTNDSHRNWVDNCYVEDATWNAIMIYSDPGDKGRWNRKPCTFNTITNCVAVRGGHSSFDVHTACPDSYVVGCLAREKGKDYEGKAGACGFYLHNFDIQRMRVVGNAVTECYWGIALTGGSRCLLADNLVCGNARGISLARGERWGAYDAGTDCVENVIQDNIVFDVGLDKDWVYAISLAGAAGNVLTRNYAERPGREYGCYEYLKAAASGNSIADPLKGRESITVDAGPCTLSFSPTLGPSTRYRLSGAGKTEEKAIGPEGVFFGLTGKGTFVVETVGNANGLGAPQHVRIAALPNVEGGAAIIWGDYFADDTGFAVERRLADERDFQELAKVAVHTTRCIDKDVGRKKAFYRVRALFGERRSEPSNEDELVRYGYWFTDRTGLAVEGERAFAQVENGELKTLIAEKAKHVERKAEAEEGISAFALLEAAADGKTEASIARAAPKQNGKAQVWLVASKPVTVTLRWRAGFIRGHVEGEGGYALELAVCGGMVKDASFNGKPAKIAFDEATKRARLELSGSGNLLLRCGE